MGLISKTAIIKCGTRNKKYYELKGYNINLGDYFEVKVEDLSHGTNALVDIECDECKIIIENIAWSQYLKCVKEDGKYYCTKCANKLYGHNNIVKSQLKNGITFEQWCCDNLTKEQIDEILSRWDEEKNGCKPRETLHASEGINKRGYWFKCPRGIHESELKNITSFTKGKLGSLNCTVCNSFAQWGVDNIGEDFLEKYWSIKNTANPWEISYGSCSSEIYIICQDDARHPDYKTTCNRFSNNIKLNKGCPKCAIVNKTGCNSPKWRGGITSLNNFLRDLITPWNKDSIANCNYKCALSGGKFHAVHHLKSFNLIVEETLTELNLPIYNTLSQYTVNQLQSIKEKCLELHYKYGLGVCLSDSLHNLFHSIYGRGNNIPEQFYEFKENYINNKYSLAI